MRLVNMHEAKSKLSKLVEEALAGEEIVVAAYSSLKSPVILGESIH